MLHWQTGKWTTFSTARNKNRRQHQTKENKATIFQACIVLMPRKKIKTARRPLQFVERPAEEARACHSPEVRAALNPKDFFSRAQGNDGSTLNSWVCPQFDTSAAKPVKRKGGKISTSIQSNFSQISRKNYACSNKFPALSFTTKGDCLLKQRKEVLDKTISSASNAHVFSEKAKTCDFPNLGTVESDLFVNDGTKSLFEKSKKTTSLCQTGRVDISSEAPASCTSKDSVPVHFTSPMSNSVTPKMLEDYSCTYSNFLNLFWASPSSDCTEDILVPDTPERDYGIKVTWRRRKKLMQLLKDRGHLTDSEVEIIV